MSKGQLRKINARKETYYQCTYCKDKIFWNTHKKLISCRCGKISVDGCEDYIRIGANQGDYIVVEE